MINSSKIIVVDDDSIVTTTLNTLFRVEGFSNVTFFNNPKEAIELIKLEKPDLIISDFMMPEMNGIEFLAEAKKLYPKITMILLTGYADKENAIKAINEIGIYKYIEKPWDNDELIINIKNALERNDLIEQLQEKIVDLQKAKKQVEEYSHSLEKIVAQRTADLIQSNSKLKAIINYCADGVIIFTENGKIELANPAAENIAGISEKMFFQKNIANIFTSEQCDFDKSILNQEKEIILRNYYIENIVNANKIPVEISIAPIYKEKEEDAIRYVSVIRNVSIQKDLDRLRDDFIATLTHDLRTPLLATIQTLSFFLDGSLGQLDDKQKNFLSTMKKSNEDILGLVNALLEVYKYESGQLHLCKTNFLVNEFIKQCISEIEVLANRKEIDISFECKESNEMQINADRTEIKRVIFNLLGNAINHNPTKTKIIITTKINNNDLIISIKDNGEGIPIQDIPNMFKRFSQGTSNKRSVGTGLGLYLSRQIIEAHGGKIWLESNKKTGTEFLFMLQGVMKPALSVK